MTTVEELQEEIMLFIKNKREELESEVDENTLPFIKTLAEPETEDESQYAQRELDNAIMDKSDCDGLLNDLEEWLIINGRIASKNKRGHA